MGEAIGASFSLKEDLNTKPYDYELLLPGAAVYMFEYYDKVDVDATMLDFFITRDAGVEPVGISVLNSKEKNEQFTKITVDMLGKVNEELLTKVVKKVVSGEYTLSASEHDRWSVYIRERKYPIINASALQEFINEKLTINPIGVSTSGVRIVVHMPQPVNKAQIEAVVNEFLQQKGIMWAKSHE